MEEEIEYCYHQCSGNCRRVGCNCRCGEFHAADPKTNRVFTDEQLEQIEKLKEDTNEEN